MSARSRFTRTGNDDINNFACTGCTVHHTTLEYHHWSVEVWAIASLLTFQEIPFLLSRLYFIFGLKVIKTQMMIFFTAKNFLTIAVYSYRIIFWKPWIFCDVACIFTFAKLRSEWSYPYVRLRYFWKKCENDIRFEKAEKFVNSIRRFSTSTAFQQTAESNNERDKTKKRSFGKKKLGRLVISNWAKVSLNNRYDISSEFSAGRRRTKSALMFSCNNTGSSAKR